ncbi:MAG: response regulator transcription factor [Saprospiraceae bacterium]|nr:response regulator transcription factor [Saprospiraceae bacterium]MCF8249042.1 response regulator transcription factor [Saprospiraceae bacterium]MCF8282667.1 response regulator transcription factor [Bacteroidales bacterium]MCF8311064.1 response regulator transcription factor [Saprospiraceae bacterium]
MHFIDLCLRLSTFQKIAAQTMAQYQIILADDHQIILDGLCEIVAHSKEFLVVGTVTSGREALTAVHEKKPDLLLMDLNMPGKDGLEVLREVKNRFPEVKVLVLTMYDSMELVQQALAAGADGYLLKEHGKEELLEALECVMAGEKYFSEKLKNRLQSKQHQFSDDFQRKISLTDRETEILRLIVESYTNKEIGDKLFISEFTVQTHRRNLKRKLKAEHTADLVRFAFENGILEQ